MNTYIAILRGINVSGQKKIKMAELREHLAELNFDSLKTYIQSGNILFQSNQDDLLLLESLIAGKISEKYGFEVPVMVRTMEDWERIHSSNPFSEVPETEYNRLFVAFLDQSPISENVAVLESIILKNEVYSIEGREVYFYCPDGIGKSKLNNNLLERKLKVKATTRNFKTIQKMMSWG